MAKPGRGGASPTGRKGTATRAFGAGARESHDASAFYARFRPKALSDDETLAEAGDLGDRLVCGDARNLDLPDRSVALVVTSPPYFAGKEYEEALGHGGIPASYAEYLELLRDVFRECLRVLEPGGRIAVNVANLGRRPYRSLAADVVGILDDDLGMLLRGEIIWRKAEGASGSCAWGSFRSPANPVLRDVTERVVVASKGRFDRALDVERRRREGRPHEATISTDEFLDATLDVWTLRPESARRVGHPAPFPVELPRRLIELYTYRGDMVLDPFLGSGSTAVAAALTGRRYAGYDTDPAYVQLAATRLDAVDRPDPRPVDGRAAGTVAADLVAAAGFAIVQRDRPVPGLGLRLPLVGRDRTGREWAFDLHGALTASPAGLARTDVVWRAAGRAAVVAAQGVGPLVLLSSHLPSPRSSGPRALRSLGPGVIHDVIGLRDPAGASRLAAYAEGRTSALPGFWSPEDLTADGVSPSR